MRKQNKLEPPNKKEDNKENCKRELNKKYKQWNKKETENDKTEKKKEDFKIEMNVIQPNTNPKPHSNVQVKSKTPHSEVFFLLIF